MPEEATTQRAAATPVWKPWATIAVSALIGPLVGLAALIVPFAVGMAVDQGPSAGLPMLAVLAFPLAWVFAFIFGAVPAAIGGVALVAFERYGPPTISRVIAGGAIGAVVAAAFALVALGIKASGGDTLSFVAVGAVSGAVCARLTRRWRYRAVEAASVNTAPSGA